MKQKKTLPSLESDMMDRKANITLYVSDKISKFLDKKLFERERSDNITSEKLKSRRKRSNMLVRFNATKEQIMFYSSPL